MQQPAQVCSNVAQPISIPMSISPSDLASENMRDQTSVRQIATDAIAGWLAGAGVRGSTDRQSNFTRTGVLWKHP